MGESLPRRNRGADDSIPMRVVGAPQTSRARGVVRGSAEVSNQRYLRPLLQHARPLPDRQPDPRSVKPLTALPTLGVKSSGSTTTLSALNA